MHEAVQYIHDHGERLREEHDACDRLGRLSDPVRDVLKASGGMRLLQATSHGGFEADPLDFFAWVRAVGRYNASAGWVGGVVGVHPWEIALCDPKLQGDIYDGDADTWVASPYAPTGTAVREGDGFRFSGRWQYSTGTDHCGWVVLGGLVVDPDDPDAPPEPRHFFLPRGDYEIVEDSWNVMGLLGTGSKDIQIEGSFVPEYRTLCQTPLMLGQYADRRPGSALFSLPWGSIFSAAIGSAAFGIAEGAIERYREYLKTRVSAIGVVGKTDPFQQQALGEVEADLEAGILHMDADIAGWMRQLEQGDAITKSQRLAFRRNQVRSVQRLLFGVDKLFSRAGSAAIWSTRPLERYWRDLRTAGSHLCNTADTVYSAWAHHEYETGVELFVMH